MEESRRHAVLNESPEEANRKGGGRPEAASRQRGTGIAAAASPQGRDNLHQLASSKGAYHDARKGCVSFAEVEPSQHTSCPSMAPADS
ncbi:hypothetical protein NDU88_008027 [Pleurodeles waltl]|uniref:Uncharacterized protein n=1 Tax=Pleurodeles waltl TaxID=8319 RepID=A0AAV7QPM0_PLEWA|nr:hypothetical protein NDU88_008027 [Pleurodeles waltl]